MNHKLIRKLVAEAQALRKANVVGPNSGAVLELKRLSREILVAAENNSSVDGKCSSIVEFAEVAYAPRKRISWTREEAAHYLDQDLATILVILDQFEAVAEIRGTKRH